MVWAWQIRIGWQQVERTRPMRFLARLKDFLFIERISPQPDFPCSSRREPAHFVMNESEQS